MTVPELQTQVPEMSLKQIFKYYINMTKDE